MADATERRSLAVCAFVSGCILIAPGEVIAASTAWFIAATIFTWHIVRSRKEAEKTAAPPLGLIRRLRAIAAVWLFWIVATGVSVWLIHFPPKGFNFRSTATASASAPAPSGLPAWRPHPKASSK